MALLVFFFFFFFFSVLGTVSSNIVIDFMFIFLVYSINAFLLGYLYSRAFH